MSETTETKRVGGIHRKMLKLMEEVGAIPKNRSGQGINYKFRGIDDLYEAVHSGLRVVGVSMIPVMVPGSLKVDVRESTGQNGNTKLNTTVTFELQVTFVDVDDGSTISVLVPAQGTDNSDKAAGKAMSYGMKNALFHVLAIPTEDPDAERPDTTVPKKASKVAKTEPVVTPVNKGTPAPEGAKSETNWNEKIAAVTSVQELNALILELREKLEPADQLKLAPTVKARRTALEAESAK